MKNLRKTHPMVLIAATALTLFSLLGSAAITGLLPTAADLHSASTLDEAGVANSNNAEGATSTQQLDSPRDTQQGQVACMNCGTVVAILALEGQINSTGGNKEYRMAPAYQIKVRMHNGTYQTLVQQARPHYLIGDVIRLERRQATV
jgi:hypothetical protein